MSKPTTCSFCGSNIEDYTKPCPMCGKIQTPDLANIINDNQQTSICPNCGTANPQNYSHCSNCSISPSGNIPHGNLPPTQGSYIPPMGTTPPNGTIPPHEANSPNPYGGANIQPGPIPPSGAYPPPTPGAYPAIFDPLGGIDPNETINGIPVSDFATFIGKNSDYYIPKFFNMSKTGRKISWNWPSFFLGGYWYLFRRMIKVSFIFIVINMLFTNLIDIMRFADFYYNITGSQLFSGNDLLYNFYFNRSLEVELIFSLIAFLPNLIFAFYSNWFYFNYCTNKIKHVRSISLDQHQYRLNLADKGRTKVSNSFIFIGILISTSVFFAFVAAFTS